MVNVSRPVRRLAAVVVVLCTAITCGTLPAAVLAAPAPSPGLGRPVNHGGQLSHAGTQPRPHTQPVAVPLVCMARTFSSGFAGSLAV
jgi:hypothetical protein